MSYKLLIHKQQRSDPDSISADSLLKGLFDITEKLIIEKGELEARIALLESKLDLLERMVVLTNMQKIGTYDIEKNNKKPGIMYFNTISNKWRKSNEQGEYSDL